MAAFGLLYPTQTHAISGGLLNGKPMYTGYGANPNWIADNKATDNNYSTYILLSRLNPYYLEGRLSTPATIESYYINFTRPNSIPPDVKFYDSSGVLLKTIPAATTGTYSVKLNNVSKVRIDVGNSGSNDPYNIYEFDLLETLPIPNNLVATSGTKKIDLSWSYNPGSNFSGYDVFMNGQKHNSEPIMTKSYTVSSLLPDQIHSFYVVANYGSQKSEPSNIVTAYAYDDEMIKPVLSATSFQNKIDLVWNPVIRAVEYSLYANGVILYSGTNLDFTHDNLPLNSSYQYVVVAKDKYSREISSNVLIANTREPPAPVIPEIEVLKKTFNMIQLRWTSLDAPYTLYKNGEIVSSNLSTNTFVFSGTLTSGTLYTFKVGYTDTYGRYIESPLIDVTTEALPAPLYPVLQANNITTNSVRLQWNQTGTQYKILKDGLEIGQSNAIFYPVYSLAAETSYQFQVIATDIYGRENASNILTVKTLENPPPKPTAPPATPPPAVSDSNNPDLNKANDHLVQGAKDTKSSFLNMIWIIIAIFILVFGSWWLLKVFKNKMAKSTVGKAKGSSRSVGSPLRKPSSSVRIGGKTYSANGYKNTNYNSRNGGSGRKTYYVEKTYRTSKNRRF